MRNNTTGENFEIKHDETKPKTQTMTMAQKVSYPVKKLENFFI